MYHFSIQKLFVGFTLLLGVVSISVAGPAWSGAGEPLLKPGIAVHSFGVSPDADLGDGNATLRLYDARDRDYETDRPTADFSKTYSHPDWTINKIGNVYGIAIDRDRNIYATASANWSPGYVGEGNSSNANVPVSYGVLGGGETNNSAGTVYKMDAMTGEAMVFAKLPQVSVNIVNEVCQGSGASVQRDNVGAGLGNVVYDKFHDQLFVSNFSDGNIYRVDMQGTILSKFDTGLGGINGGGKILKSAYGLAVSPNGDKLYYGTMETNYHPKLFAISLTADGDFFGSAHDEQLELTSDLSYTQNIGGDAYSSGIWAAYSDIDFTPKGELLLGVRVGCKENFATSYNHGGVVYLLEKRSDQWVASDKTDADARNKATSYDQEPNTSDNSDTRAGYHGSLTDRQDLGDSEKYLFDNGSIPLHPDMPDQETLQYGPDDGYGGVAVWETAEGDHDIFATSADITSRGGVHGFMQINGDFNITEYAVVNKAIGYGAVRSSTADVKSNDELRYDYKGIGGDVEVLSVIPVSIGSYVWIDDGNGKQGDTADACLDDVTVTLHRANDMSVKVYDLNGTEVVQQTTHDCGKYYFGNLPEGNYRVCVLPPADTDVHFAPTVNQNSADNNNSEFDSNIKEKLNGEYCSGTFGVFANVEPQESTDERGDDADNEHDIWGNMTVDFGFVKQVFDLALIKKLDGDADKKYKIGDTVTFTITVKNQGDVNATNVVIKDTLPKGLELDDDQWNSNGTLKTPIALIEPGEEESVQITCKITDEVGEQDTLINVAEIESAENPYDLNDTDSTPGENPCSTDMSNDDNYDGDTPKGCDDVDPAPIHIEQHFDLALVKFIQDPKDSYSPGDEVTFTIGIANQGTVTGKDIQIRDIIPEGLELSDNAWKLDGDEAVLKTPIASLAPGDYTTREITFVIAKDFKGDKIVNIAEIKDASNDLDLADDDSTPDDNPCAADMDHNNDINSSEANAGGCDDVDPAWITVNVQNVSASPDNAADECDCAEVESNTVDALNVWSLVLMVLWSLLAGLFAMRSRKYV